jgi:hypothetical protein
MRGIQAKRREVLCCSLVIAFLLLAWSTSGLARDIGWVKHTIDANFGGAYDVFRIDLDRDGDMDVLGAANYSDRIDWWENDGYQNFTRHNIDPSVPDAHCVYAIDLDCDNDVDVLGAAARHPGAVIWWENDGNQNFIRHIITDHFVHAYGVYAIDLDDDADIDVLGVAVEANEVAWWENDGEQDFTKHTIDGNFGGACDLYVTDLDRDSDLDVVAAASAADEMAWYENDGNQNFTKSTIDDSFDGAFDVDAVDLDSDGDVDVLGAAYLAHRMTWWENDGNENFTQHTIDGSFTGACSICAADLDRDGNVDILGAARGDNQIAWWENVDSMVQVTLTPHNPPIQIPPQGGWFTYDGVVTNSVNTGITVDAWTMVFLPTGQRLGPNKLFQDIDLAAYGDTSRTISHPVKRWAPAGEYTYVGYVGYYLDTKLDSSYFNFTKLESRDFASGEVSEMFDIFAEELEFEEPVTALLGAYPSPFNVRTNITYDLAHDGLARLEIYDLRGRRVATLVDWQQSAGRHTITWDASENSSGLYFYKLTAGDLTETRRVMLVKREENIHSRFRKP